MVPYIDFFCHDSYTIILKPFYHNMKIILNGGGYLSLTGKIHIESKISKFRVKKSDEFYKKNLYSIFDVVGTSSSWLNFCTVFTSAHYL